MLTVSLVVLSILMVHGVTSNCSSSRGCYPNQRGLLHENSKSAKTLEANSTCSSPDEYQGLGTINGSNFTCSETNDVSKMRDKYEREVDGSNGSTQKKLVPNLDTYWQSKRVITASGVKPSAVTVTALFHSVFTVTNVRLYFKALHAPAEKLVDSRPRAMFFEKLDRDNSTWVPWKYFSDFCSNFSSVIHFKPEDPSPSATTPYCTEDKDHKWGHNYNSSDTFYVEFNPGSDYNTEFMNNEVVSEYYKTSGVRATLVEPRFNQTLQSYYAVSDFSVEGYCYCNGHGYDCNGTHDEECVCGHFTTGLHCELCQPLYNNQTWKMGKVNSANACQKCSCNDHADSCHYDKDKNYGVCDNCKNNTMGDFCTECKPGFAINPYELRDKTNETTPMPKPNGTCEGFFEGKPTTYDCGSYCIPCGCSPNGTSPDGLMKCTSSGNCTCKTYTEGQKCDVCKDGYWGMSPGNNEGCTACKCVKEGTVNGTNVCNKTTGQCPCKTNTEGQNCDTCKAITFGLSAAKEDGCTPCECDSGASNSMDCTQNGLNNGQCACKSNIGGRDCRNTTSGFFTAKLDHYRFEPEFQQDMPSDNKVERPGEGLADGTITGRGLVSLLATNNISLEFTTPLSQNFDVVLRYESKEIITGVTGSIKQVNGAEYTCNGTSIPADKSWTIPDTIPPATSKGSLTLTRLCGKPNQKYTLSITTAASTSLLIDSIVLLPVLEDLDMYKNANPAERQSYDECRNASFSVNMASRANCTHIEFSLMTAVMNGAIECSCNKEGTKDGTTCDQNGGQCQCKEGVMLRDCSVCRVDSYGLNITAGCTLCNCNLNGSVKASCNMTGFCSCKTNVTGKQCDACPPEHYGLNSGNGCQPCTCDGKYSLNNTCQDDGQCWCKPGIGGKNCDQCLPGFYNLTTENCMECGCNVGGSINNVCNNGTGKCSCRSKTEGLKCDTCAAGYFGVGGWSQEGCIKCFCSGHSTNCTSNEGWYRAVISSKWLLSDSSSAVDTRWKGIDSNGNDISVDDPTILNSPNPQYVMRIKNTPNNLIKSHLYFTSPPKFTGDNRGAYGQYFTMTLQLSTHDQLLSNYSEGDVCIKGKYSEFVLAKNLSLPGTQPTAYNVSFTENEWYINGTDSRNPSYEEFIQVLSAIEFIKVRGKYSNASDSYTDLLDFSLYTVSRQNETGESAINNVEKCVCPTGYSGDYCESCAPGFKREVENGGPFSKCIPCSCNGHDGGACDEKTGACNCTHNTTGTQCETCLDGFYGNAKGGKPDDCKACMCPGNVIAGDANVFAKTCELDASGEPKCINCTTGHSGNKCEVCEQNYYGQPENVTVNQGKCVACVCNGRADTCNTTTGDCINCRNNTAGKTCDICASKYFGDAMTNSCEACVCNSTGSNGDCNPTTGDCKCFDNVEGPKCDRCVANSFNFSSGSGCQKCDCHLEGSQGPACDQDSGQCTCRQNVINRQCNACKDTYYRLNVDTGCDSCNCNKDGVANANVTGKTEGSCDLITGACTCKQPGIIGRTCDTCTKNTKQSYTHIKVFQIGTYPNCVLCGDCFDGWAKKVDSIGIELSNVSTQANNIWSNYDMRSSESVTTELTNIESSINNANQLINRTENITNIENFLTNKLNAVQGEVKNISEALDTAQTRLNSSLLTLATIASFDGFVEVDNTSVSSDTLLGNLTTLLKQLNDAFNQANISYSKINELSSLVGSAEDTTKQLQSRVTSCMTKLTTAERTSESSRSIYNGTFVQGYQANENSIREVNKAINSSKVLLKELQTIVGQISTQFTDANATMNSLINKINAALTTVREKVQESQKVYNDSKELSVAVQETYALILVFKMGADKALNNITGAFEAILEGSKILEDVANKKSQATELMNRINAVTIRPKTDMENITQAIGDTIIPPEDVAAASQNAQNALATAKAVLNTTEKALDDSRGALDEVNGINRNMEQKQTNINNAKFLKQEADNYNTTIHDAITQADSKVVLVSNLVKNSTEETRAVQSFISSVKRCYEEKQSMAESGKSKATLAKQQIDLHEQEQSNYTARETTLNQAVSNKSTNQAVNTLQKTKADLDQIKEDLSNSQKVADLTSMIQQYNVQKQEMAKLQQDIKVLETELDNLSQSLVTKSDTSVCVHG